MLPTHHRYDAGPAGVGNAGGVRRVIDQCRSVPLWLRTASAASPAFS